jgi:hypothetical protein
MAAFDVLTDRAQAALKDPGWRLATQSAMQAVAMEIIQEAAGTVDGTPGGARSERTGKRRGLANRIMDDPTSARLTDQMALALAADLTITQATTPAQFLAAVRAKWDTVARVHPEDATTPGRPGNSGNPGNTV